MLEFIPSPSQGVWHIGPVPLRAYALCIIVGALFAIWIGEKRFVSRGGKAGFIGDLAMWAIPLGIVGARVYHVLTDAQLYFGPGRDPVDALRIWEGGLGIWGAITGGALGGWIACRRANVSFADAAGAVAPGLLVAQAVGRLGNYFNQELFGRPTTLPWALEIDAARRPPGYEQFSTFHPTFLYEALWAWGLALLLLLVERRRTIRPPGLFALYVTLYCVGRLWIELLRVDPANEILGLRVNAWVSILGIAAGAVWFVLSQRRGRPRAPGTRQEPPGRTMAVPKGRIRPDR